MELIEVVFRVIVTWTVREAWLKGKNGFVLGPLALCLNDADVSMKILFYSLKEIPIRGQQTFF